MSPEFHGSPQESESTISLGVDKQSDPAAPQKERSELEQKVEQLFPEVQHGEKGRVVKEALLHLAEVGKLALEEFRILAHTIVYLEKDEPLPDQYQMNNDPSQQIFWIGGQQNGTLYLFPKFFDGTDPQKQAHIIAHEIGESMLRKEIPGPEKGMSQETVVDYTSYLEQFSTRQPSLNDGYVQCQFKNNNPERFREALADDIGDYLTSTDPLTWVAQRVARLPEPQQQELVSALLAHEHGEPVDPESLLAQFIHEAERVYAFLDSQINGKVAGESKRERLKASVARKLETGGDEDWLSYGDGARGDFHALTSIKSDGRLMNEFFDRLFGVKPLLGG